MSSKVKNQPSPEKRAKEIEKLQILLLWRRKKNRLPFDLALSVNKDKIYMQRILTLNIWFSYDVP